MEEEVEWMEHEKKKYHKGQEEEGEEEEECREAGASLWSPVWRSRHPLFIALLLVLQPGVGHRVTLLSQGRQAVKDPRGEGNGVSEQGGNGETQTHGEQSHPAVEEGFLPRLEFVGARRDRIGKLYELAAEGDLAQEEHEGIQHHPHSCSDVQRVYSDTVPDA